MKLLERFLGWILLVVAAAVPTGLCLIRGWQKEQIALTYSVVVVLIIVTWYGRLLAFGKRG
jgi:hypothetical protein